MNLLVYPSDKSLGDWSKDSLFSSILNDSDKRLRLYLNVKYFGLPTAESHMAQLTTIMDLSDTYDRDWEDAQEIVR